MDIRALLLDFTPDSGVCAFETVSPFLLPCRAASRLPERPQSIIMMIFPYRFPDTPDRNLSRYACVPDYHIAAGAVLQAAADRCAALYPDYHFVPFLDNSPIPEVKAAAAAGLGMIGRHGLLIHPTYGSFVFLGELVTDLPLAPTGNGITYCPGCGACAAACPGGCLPDHGREHCISAISQKKGDLTTDEAALLKQGGLIWGCDRCQEICPMNHSAAIAPHPCFTDYMPRFLPEDPAFDTRAYAWRGRSVPLRNARLLWEDQADI